MDSYNNIGSVLNRNQRLILGCLILILVDVIWVSTWQLSKYLFGNESFEKPFFCSYVKTSLFSIYLLGFLLWPPWRHIFSKPIHYIHIDPDQDDDNYYSEVNTCLSNPVYVPVKTPERENLERNSSGSDTSESTVRSVRFNKLAEVRHMSEAEATEALLARLSYQASLRAGLIARRAAARLSLLEVVKLALAFSLLWFGSMYTYHISLLKLKPGMVSVLSSTSGVFIVVLAALFPSNQGDKFNCSKICAVYFGIAGLIAVCHSNLSLGTQVPVSAIYTLISSLCSAAYLVLLKRKVDHEDQLDIPMFLGFVGLFTLLLLWPLFYFLHFSELELFEWPTKNQILMILLNGIIGSVISDALWLWASYLTSSLMATVAVFVSIPMTMTAEVMMKKLYYPSLFFSGIIPILVALIAVTALTYYETWDPIYNMLHYVYVAICRRARSRRFRFSETTCEQCEALIGINDEHEA